MNDTLNKPTAMTDAQKQQNSIDDLFIRLLARMGVDYKQCTPEEWLDLAIDCERHQRLCGRLDPAYSHFENQKREYEKIAALAERKRSFSKSS
jgi:hypothetical protein